MNETAAFGRPEVAERLLQGIQHEAGVSGARHPPADDPPGKGVDDEVHGDEALPSRHIREIRDPKGVRAGHPELAVHPVGRARYPSVATDLFSAEIGTALMYWVTMTTSRSPMTNTGFSRFAGFGACCLSIRGMITLVFRLSDTLAWTSIRYPDTFRIQINIVSSNQNCRYFASGSPCFSTSSFELTSASRFSSTHNSARFSAIAYMRPNSAARDTFT